MKDSEDRDIEGLLHSVRLKPAPPRLRERILEAAAKHKEETAWTTRRLRWCLTGCAAVLAVIFITDAGLSRRQQDRLQAMINGSRPTQDQAGDESRVLAEALGESLSPKMLGQSKLAISRQRAVEQLRREDILKELSKEDFDGHESPKNNH